MMRRPVTILDVDGVVANFVQAWLDALERMTGARHQHDDCVMYDYDHALGIPKEDAERVWREIETPGYAFGIEPYEGAVRGVMALAEVADIVWCTTPVASPTWTYDRERWLKRHFERIGARVNVVHCTAKHMVRGDVFVDDKPANVKQWAEHWPSGDGVLWTRPWNANSTIARRCPNTADRWEWLVDQVARRV